MFQFPVTKKSPQMNQTSRIFTSPPIVMDSYLAAERTSEDTHTPTHTEEETLIYTTVHSNCSSRSLRNFPYTLYNTVICLLCVGRCSLPPHIPSSYSVSRQLKGTVMRTAEHNTRLAIAAAENLTSLMKTGRETKRGERAEKNTKQSRH